jgi:arylsulfatase A-like enzyme
MPTNRPNIVFILTDDQGPWALGCAGNREIITPNLDALAANGVRFDNFFCASPVCSPARASLLTGRIPSQHGVHDWIRAGNLAPAAGVNAFGNDDRVIEYLAGMPAYTDTLAANGYTCALSGKWHLGDSIKAQKGFTYWLTIPYGGSDYYNPPVIADGRVWRQPGYLTEVITEGALRFLDQHAGRSNPFYLSVHYTAPHSPWDKGQHPEDIVALYADCPFASCPDEPVHPWQSNTAPRGVGEKRRELLSGYFAAVTALDRGVGRILAHLDRLRLRENTLIVFGSDNGMNMGHHGVWGKGNGTFPLNMYDTSVKVPFIMSWPGRIAGGVVCDRLLSQYDVLPTLLDYLGMDNPQAANLPGHSFAPFLRGEVSKEHEAVVVCDEYGPVRMVRTRDWKYVHRYPYGPHELYDLHNDPEERANLIGDSAQQGKVSEMRLLLHEWFLRHSDPDLDGRQWEVYGKGQIERVGRAGRSQPAFADDQWSIDAEGRRLAPS